MKYKKKGRKALFNEIGDVIHDGLDLLPAGAVMRPCNHFIGFPFVTVFRDHINVEGSQTINEELDELCSLLGVCFIQNVKQSVDFLLVRLFWLLHVQKILNSVGNKWCCSHVVSLDYLYSMAWIEGEHKGSCATFSTVTPVVHIL